MAVKGSEEASDRGIHVSVVAITVLCEIHNTLLFYSDFPVEDFRKLTDSTEKCQHPNVDRNTLNTIVLLMRDCVELLSELRVICGRYKKIQERIMDDYLGPMGATTTGINTPGRPN